MIYTVLDIETTGFIKFDKRKPNLKSDDILEVGYLQFNSKDMSIVRGDSFYFYQDHFNIESNAQSIHKLTREFLQDEAPYFTRNLATLYSLLHKGYVVGKNNARFDLPFIDSFLAHYASDLGDPVVTHIIDVQIYMAPYYRDWYLETYRESAGNKSGTLMDYMTMLGHTPEVIDTYYHSVFPNSDRTGEHSALYDSYMTFIALAALVDAGAVNLVV